MGAPRDIRAFLRRPTRKEWNQELLDGWAGPDGSTLSDDAILGVRIGIMSPEFTYVDLPANRHDWYYRLARRYRLPSSWRQRADGKYRDMCRRMTSLAFRRNRFRRWIAWLIAGERYFALRIGARFAWTRKAERRLKAWVG
jgi:hypothetical protein